MNAWSRCSSASSSPFAWWPDWQWQVRAEKTGEQMRPGVRPAQSRVREVTEKHGRGSASAVIVTATTRIPVRGSPVPFSAWHLPGRPSASLQSQLKSHRKDELEKKTIPRSISGSRSSAPAGSAHELRMRSVAGPHATYFGVAWLGARSWRQHMLAFSFDFNLIARIIFVIEDEGWTLLVRN